MLIMKKSWLKTALLALLLMFTLLICAFAYHTWDIWAPGRLLPEPPNQLEEWTYHAVFESFTPAEQGYSLLIDLDEKVLILYEDGLEAKSWPVSGGTKENPSPTGAWKVSDISNWGSGFGGSWIALNVPWGKYGIHGTVEPWAVGVSNISHGCIRMKNADVAELKKYMKWGVPVFIKHDTAPLRALKDGKVGSDVLKLQEMLRQLCYYKGLPDGRFGPATLAALRQFQREEGMKVDGIAGQASWELLQQTLDERRRSILPPLPPPQELF